MKIEALSIPNRDTSQYARQLVKVTIHRTVGVDMEEYTILKQTHVRIPNVQWIVLTNIHIPIARALEKTKSITPIWTNVF